MANKRVKIPCSCQENKNPKTNMIQGYHNCLKCNGTGFVEVNSDLFIKSKELKNAGRKKY